MKSTLVWTFLLALLASSAAGAAVYVWKDEAGKTVYSDQPPPSVNARRMNTRAPAPASAPAKEAKKATGGKDVDSENARVVAENAKISEANAKIRDQNCKGARDQLASLQQNGRIRMPGSNALATDAQRNELIAQAQSNVQTWCGK